jgi:hypothetical protein
LFKLFWLAWWMCVSTALTALWFHHLLLMWCDWEIYHHLSGITLQKSKPNPFSVFCVHPWAFSEPILCKTCDDNLA